MGWSTELTSRVILRLFVDFYASKQQNQSLTLTSVLI